MKKIILAGAFALFGLSTMASAPPPTTLNGFIMFWEFVNADGTPLGYHEDICKGGTIYLKNKSTYNNTTTSSGIPIGNLLDGTTGHYNIKRWPDNFNIINIPAANWDYDEVISVVINTDFDYAGGINLRITHFGAGVSPYDDGLPGPNVSRHHTRFLKTWAKPTVSAGPDDAVCAFEEVILDGSASPSGCTFSWSPSGSIAENLTIYPSATTTYILTATKLYTDFNGNQFSCSATDQVKVTVKPGPNLHLIDYVLCSEDPMPILDAGPSPVSYQWSFIEDGTTLSTDAGFDQTVNTGLYGYGLYTVTVYGANGCSSEESAEVILNSSAAANINAAFDFTATNTATTDIVATAEDLTGDHWWGIFYTDPTCTSNPLFPFQPPYTGGPVATFNDLPLNSYYKIIHKVKKSPCDEWVEKARCTYQTAKFIVHASPNPTTGVINILLENFNPEIVYTVELYDSFGNEMESFTMTVSEITRDISSYKNDTYTIVVKDGVDIGSFKIVKM